MTKAHRVAVVKKSTERSEKKSAGIDLTGPKREIRLNGSCYTWIELFTCMKQVMVLIWKC